MLLGQVSVALTVLLIAGCATTASAPTMRHRSPEQPVELIDRTVPWSQVGSGWTLATATDSAEPDTITLFLVSPGGQRYAVTRFQAARSRLIDWSGDGRRALFVQNNYDFGTTTLTEIDLRSGARRTNTLEGRVSARFTRPNGRALLVAGEDPGGSETLRRIDPSGVEQLTYPTDRLGGAGTFNGHHLATADGTRLVLGTTKGLAVMGNNGGLRNHLPVPGPNTNCAPIRWWSTAVVLARCSNAQSVGTQLWRIPLDGTAPTAVTAFTSGRGDDPGFRGDYGDVAAWRLPDGPFVQSLGTCGAARLSRVTPDLRTVTVRVPGTGENESVVVVGATGDTLLVRTTMSCGPGVALLAFRPAAHTATVLLGPPVTGGSVSAALAYRDDR